MEPSSSASPPPPLPHVPWRALQRMRTVSCAIILCLNIGVDPPDSSKPHPCARLECWFDPDSAPPLKALKAIGTRLKSAYEGWHEKGKYRVELDPTSEALRKLLLLSRKSAGEERLLMHYNGHGVPKPTANGEIWVYNSGYTQYIPVSMYDVQAWMGPFLPAIYVIDCNQAGLVLEAFQHFLKQRKDREEKRKANVGNNGFNNENNQSSSSNTQQSESNDVTSPIDSRHLFLCACASDESLPLSADLPADLFTSCLVTPVKMALRWHALRSPLIRVTNATIDSIPGLKKPNDRKKPYGELNWIFTAITDSIAWSTLPLPVFHALFRSDLLVAALFRNHFLAHRIFHSYDLHTVTQPVLPSTHNHPMWQSWDLAVDHCLAQLERLELEVQPVQSEVETESSSNVQEDEDSAATNGLTSSASQSHAVFMSSQFFEQQLTAFELWLEFGNERQAAPMQLPVVLQVLLSAELRRRALLLLVRYLDKGVWAVHAALNVGIFPYVLKLLSSPDPELKEVLMFIWSKIIAYDVTTVHDLCKPEYCAYFVNHFLHYGMPLATSHTAKVSSMTSSIGNEPFLADTLNGSSTTPSGLPDTLVSEKQAAEFTDKMHPSFSPFSNNVSSPLHSLPKNNSDFVNNTNVSQEMEAQIRGVLSPRDPSALSKHALRWISNVDNQRLFAAFILANLAHSAPRAAQLLSSRIPSHLSLIHPHSSSSNPLLRRWTLLCLAQLWRGHPAERLEAAKQRVHEHVFTLLSDPEPQVRATALLTLSALFGKNTTLQPSSSASTIDERDRVEIEIHIGYVMSTLCLDGAALVRREMVLALSECIYHHTDLFVSINAMGQTPPSIRNKVLFLRHGWLIWRSLLRCCRDSDTSVSSAALEVRKWIKSRAVVNPVGKVSLETVHRASALETTTEDSVSSANPPQSIARQNGSQRYSMGTPFKAALPYAGLRHFDRHKMSHMRPQPHLQAQSSALEHGHGTTVDLNSLDEENEEAGAHATIADASIVEFEPLPVDERANDPMWTVPKSTLLVDGAAEFRHSFIPLLLSNKEEIVPPLAQLRQQLAKSARWNAASEKARKMADGWHLGSTQSFVEVAFFDSQWEATSCVLLSEVDSHLYACDTRSSVGIWGYASEDRHTAPSRLNNFNNQNTRGSRLSVMRLINKPSEQPLLLVGSDDGVVRLWRDVTLGHGRQTLITAFAASPHPEFSNSLNRRSQMPCIVSSPDSSSNVLTSLSWPVAHPLASSANSAKCPATVTMVSTTATTEAVSKTNTSQTRKRSRCPLILDWASREERLAASSHGSALIKVWDVQAERCICDLSLPVPEVSSTEPDVILSIACIISGANNMLYAGCSNGRIEMFDMRVSTSATSCGSLLLDSAAVALALVPSSSFDFCAMSAGGIVSLFDLRRSHDVQMRYQRLSHQRHSAPVTSFAAHSILPLFASASFQRPVVEVFDHSMHTVDSIKYHLGFLGQRIGPVHSICFHPQRAMIALGCQDSALSIFAFEK